MNHLTDRYVRFTPDAGLGPAAELVLDLDLPDADRGSAATVVSVPAGGGVPEFTAVSLSRHGNAHVQVPFAPADVDRVDLVLTNASTRTTCWQSVRSRYSCYGHPADDGLGFEYFASVSP
jgi:hypothetical protein